MGKYENKTSKLVAIIASIFLISKLINIFFILIKSSRDVVQEIDGEIFTTNLSQDFPNVSIILDYVMGALVVFVALLATAELVEIAHRHYLLKKGKEEETYEK